jgi:hypothetical protein
MACLCGAENAGGPCLCEFTSLEQVVGGTLIDSLSPAIDCVRDLYTQLGLRSYQVNLVWTRWTGGERGVGQEYVLAAQALLPTPKLMGLGGVQIEQKELGANEQGSVTVSEISMRYTEDLLMGRAGPVPEGAQIPLDVSFFWEVLLPSAGAPGGIRRRFTPSGAPERNSGKFEWSIRLTETEGARLRDGRVGD